MHEEGVLVHISRHCCIAPKHHHLQVVGIEHLCPQQKVPNLVTHQVI